MEDVMPENLDAKVLQLMDEVKKRREKVGSLKKPQWSTSCSLQLPGQERLNLQVVTDLGLLAYACGTLKRMEQDINLAAKELEVDIEPKWQNYPIEDWIADIKLRVRVTQIRAEQEKLAKLEAKLKPLVSEDQRRKMALAEIEEDMKDSR
jgi:hypothetical protein